MGDALERAVDAADHLAGRHPIRIIIDVGRDLHGPLSDRAKQINQSRWGREVISLPGPSIDPRPADAADVVIGMGHSVLRAMVIRKPVIVQGEQGLSEGLEPSTRERFLRQGFWGVGERLLDERHVGSLVLRISAGCDGGE